MSGWRVELNLEKPAILNLGGYVSGSKMQLQGDPLFLADLRTERYHIAAPPGVCGPNTGTSYSATGATADSRDRNKANASNPGSRYLWAGYMYLTPIVGVWNGSSIQGSQSGINKLGQYHCWHRTYDVGTGRWTTPDPAATPTWNLNSYVRCEPIDRTDVTGLVEFVSELDGTAMTDFYKINVKTISLTLGTCGMFSWKAAFELVPGARRSGYFVQEMKWVETVVDCETEEATTITDEYLESWTVSMNQSVAIPSHRMKIGASEYDDDWYSPARPNTAGSISVEGRLFFMETGDVNALDDLKWKGASAKKWGKLEGTDDAATVKSGAAGVTRSIRGATLSVATVHRKLRVEWDCCPKDGKKRTTPTIQKEILGCVTGDR